MLEVIKQEIRKEEISGSILETDVFEESEHKLVTENVSFKFTNRDSKN